MPSFARAKDVLWEAPLLPENFSYLHHGGWMLMLGPRVEALYYVKPREDGSKATWRYRPASVLPSYLWGIDHVHRVVMVDGMLIKRSDGFMVEQDAFGHLKESFAELLRVVPVPVDLVERPRPRF